jgi:hypothetical protein
MSDSLATTIGESLGKGALSYVGGQAFGQILVLAGVDSGQAEMSRKLDQILAELADLRTAVDKLATDLQKVGADVMYDVSVTGVLGLINVNTTLNDAFRTLLMAEPEEQLKIRESITSELEKLTTGGATWDNCLRGGSGQTGLIEGWGRKVRANSADWFSPGSASAIQSQWDYYDAQQALTVAYLVELHNLREEPTMARRALETWSENRKLQLGMLRGTLRHEEKVIESWMDVRIEPGQELLINNGASKLPVKNCTSTSVTVRAPNWTPMRLNFLPPNTAIHISSHTMWCLTIGEEVNAQDVEHCGRFGYLGIACHTDDLTGLAGWRLQSYYKIKPTLFARAGINDVSNFHDGLTALGFVFPAHQAARINLWTLDSSEYVTGEFRAYRGSIKQPGGWDNPWGDLHDMGNVLLGRDVGASEMPRYLH